MRLPLSVRYILEFSVYVWRRVVYVEKLENRLQLLSISVYKEYVRFFATRLEKLSRDEQPYCDGMLGMLR